MKKQLSSLKLLTTVLSEYCYDSLFRNSLYCVSFRTTNWGDYLNKVLLEKITGLNVHIVHINHLHNSIMKKLYKKKQILSAIGSIMHHVPDDAIIWGTGCVYYSNQITIRPSKILSVRGPMTASVLKKSGYNCPDIYGDPALLIKKHFKPEFTIKKKYEFGIIPHMSETNLAIVHEISRLDGIKIIDIEGEFDKIIKTASECKMILSSSLHGLILADELSIKNLWVRFRNDFPGDNFKFNDYYASIYNKNEMSLEPLKIINSDDVSRIFSIARNKAKINEHQLNINLLEDVFLDYLNSNGMI